MPFRGVSRFGVSSAQFQHGLTICSVQGNSNVGRAAAPRGRVRPKPFPPPVAGAGIYLGVDLVLLAVKQRVHRAILITGDSDFLPAIKAAKNEGVLIHLFHGTGPQQPHRDLWEEADDRTVITPELLNTFLLTER